MALKLKSPIHQFQPQSVPKVENRRSELHAYTFELQVTDTLSGNTKSMRVCRNSISQKVFFYFGCFIHIFDRKAKSVDYLCDNTSAIER